VTGARVRGIGMRGGVRVLSCERHLRRGTDNGSGARLDQWPEPLGSPSSDCRRGGLEEQDAPVPGRSLQRGEPRFICRLVHRACELSADLAPGRGQLERCGQVQAAPSQERATGRFARFGPGEPERANIPAAPRALAAPDGSLTQSAGKRSRAPITGIGGSVRILDRPFRTREIP
jgi:hypothetical protein